MNYLIQVPFYDQPLTLIDHDGKPFVAMRPIVANMGLDWKSQHRKLISRFQSVVVNMTTTGLDGKQYKMLCLPLEQLPAWLITISPNKVKPEIKTTIERYQAESSKVLWHYWTKGYAHREEIKREMAELNEQETISISKASPHGYGLWQRKQEKQRIAEQRLNLQLQFNLAGEQP